MVNLATLEPPEDLPTLELLDPKEALETKGPQDPLALLDQVDRTDKAEAKDQPDRRVHEETQEPQDLPDSLDNRPAEAPKDHLDPQGPPANLDPLGNLVPKVHLDPRLRLETTPNTAHARHVAERPKSKQIFRFFDDHFSLSVVGLFVLFFAVDPTVSPKTFSFLFFLCRKTNNFTKVFEFHFVFFS